jgi:hypothetical protein
MTSETTRQALCCECGAMTHASGRPVREDRVRVEKAQGLTHRLRALLTHALCAEPLRPAFITPTREWSCLHHQKPPRSPAPSGSPLAPLPLGARLDPAHSVAELHRAGGVGVVSIPKEGAQRRMRWNWLRSVASDIARTQVRCHPTHASRAVTRTVQCAAVLPAYR